MRFMNLRIPSSPLRTDGRNFWLRRCASRLDLVHLSERFDNRRWSVPVCSHALVKFRSDSGMPAQSSVGGSSKLLPEIDVTGGRKPCSGNTGVPFVLGLPSMKPVERGKDPLHDLIGMVIVIPEEGGVVEEELPEVLPAFKIRKKNIIKLGKSHLIILEYMFFYG